MSQRTFFTSSLQPALDLLGLPGFGLAYPKKYELLWCNPAQIGYRIYHRNVFNGRHPTDSKRAVFAGDWDQQIVPIHESALSRIEYLKLEGLRDRILDGKPWEQTRTYEERIGTLLSTGTADGFHTEIELKARFEALDSIIQDVRQHGTLRTRKELDSGAFREKGGVPIMIDRKGNLILGRGGTHRFFICSILGAFLMPFSLIAVHPKANRHFKRVRQESQQLFRRFTRNDTYSLER